MSPGIRGAYAFVDPIRIRKATRAMRTFAGVVLGVVLVGCAATTSPTGESSSSGGGGGCADISGNYTVKESKVSGTCDISDSDASSFTFGTDTDGPFVNLPGFEGNCPGSLDASTCRFTAECKFFDLNDKSKTLATFNVDYTFSGKTFSGSMAVGSTVKSCTANIKDTGTRL